MDSKKILYFIILSFLISQTLFSFETPEILWRFTTGGRIITPPVEGSDGTLYFCSEDRFLYAINSNGELQWRTNLEDRITETLSIGIDGTLYTGSKRDFFLAVNTSGEIIWKVKLKGSPVGNPGIKSDGSLFIVTNKGWFYSISHTGFIRWEIKLPAEPVMGPILGKNIYIALNNERLYAFNIDGLKLWTFLLSGNAETIALTMDNIYVGTNNSTLVSIDYEGRKLWNKSLSGPVKSVVALTKNLIVIIHGNNIAMMDSEGNSIWTRNKTNIQIDLAAYSNEIISLDTRGQINWFDLEGNNFATLNGGLPSGRFLIASAGDVYLGSRDWLFYKYGSNGLIKTNYIHYIWPSFRGNRENSGNLLNSTGLEPDYENIATFDYIYFTESLKENNEKVLNDLLDDIESRLFNRKFDVGKSNLLIILEAMASGAVKSPLYEEGILINDFPVIRSRSIDLLGITGNLKTIEFLIDLLSYEWDDYVIKTILRSLGNLQSDKDQGITTGIYNYFTGNRSRISQSCSNQILVTVQKLNKYNGLINRRLLSLITDIFLTSSSKNTKELALDIINSIKK